MLFFSLLTPKYEVSKQLFYVISDLIGRTLLVTQAKYIDLLLRILPYNNLLRSSSFQMNCDCMFLYIFWTNQSSWNRTTLADFCKYSEMC